MKGQTYVILAILCTIIISVFAVLNMAAVEVNYLFWSGSSPLIFVILFSVLSGSILTMLFGTRKFIQLKKENKRLTQTINQMERDVHTTEEIVTEDTPLIMEDENTSTKEKDE